MKKVAHISDLHFGTEDKKIANGLLIDLNTIQPDVVVVSGDLTQRGRRKQYADARDYLAGIKAPKIIVPGNHDVPLFDIFRRFLLPLQRYKKFITEDMSPLYIDEQVIVLGINTARSFTWKNGRISIEQIQEMENVLCPLGNEKLKMVVTHHPFIPPPGDAGISLVGRSIKALDIIDKCYVDILLAGHLHHGYSGDIRKHYPLRKRSVVSVQAGTAISNRRREEPNAFNLITVTKERIHIQIREWNGTHFDKTVETEYVWNEGNWERTE